MRAKVMKRKSTGDYVVFTRSGQQIEYGMDLKKAKQKVKQLNYKADRDDIYLSAGLVKVKGALGGTYWE